MLLCNEKSTTLQPSDIMMFDAQTILFARGGDRINFVVEPETLRIDDKFFYGGLNLYSLKKLAESIAFLAGLQVQQVRLSSAKTAYQFLPSDHLRHDPDIAIRAGDVVCYYSLTRQVWFLRNQMIIDVGAERLPEFFCFAKLLSLILGYRLRVFHQTPDGLHLQFVKP